MIGAPVSRSAGGLPPGTIPAMSEMADRAEELYLRVVQLKEHL